MKPTLTWTLLNNTYGRNSDHINIILKQLTNLQVYNDKDSNNIEVKCYNCLLSTNLLLNYNGQYSEFPNYSMHIYVYILNIQNHKY